MQDVSMKSISFFPFVDIPLVAITVAAYLRHINRWAYRTDIETSLDLPSGLPKARRRIVFLFVGLGVLCWLLDFAVWSLYACILLIDLLLAAISNGGGPAGLSFIVYIVREWAFGFPKHRRHRGDQFTRQHKTTSKGQERKLGCDAKRNETMTKFPSGGITRWPERRGLSLRLAAIVWTAGYLVQLSFYGLSFLVSSGILSNSVSFQNLFNVVPVVACSLSLVAIIACRRGSITDRLYLIGVSLGLFAATHFGFGLLFAFLFLTN